MSFFQTSTGQAVQSTGTFESGGGNMAPIPEGTQVLAAVDEAKWDSIKNEDHVSLRWTVMQPEEYKNRKIFQKIKTNDADPAKRDKALAERGLDFSRAAEVFEARHFTAEDERAGYSEPRYITVGQLDVGTPLRNRVSLWMNRQIANLNILVFWFFGLSMGCRVLPP